MDNNMTIFDVLYEKYKIKKPIRLIEMFAGYGSQALALKYLNIPFEHWKICEWAVKSIQAYKDIHFPNKDVEFKEERTKDEMVEFLYRKGISSNYNEPMSRDQIKRLKEEDLKRIIKNIGITHNLVNIQQVKGEDLEIKDTDKYTYMFTYSFPCQDLSLAGKQKGMSDTSTRSGMLWEVERILSECKELGGMPEILLMENVPQVHGTDNLQDFNKWQLRLEELGYKNYMQDLIATDYGIPQTRNRCFMLSILGDYSYTFPKPIPLKLKLKDMLEDNVDEKYYLSDKQINDIKSWNTYQKPLENTDKDVCGTLTTRSGAYCADMKLTYDNIFSKEENNLKRKLCNSLIRNRIVKKNDVIRHSYTKSRMNGEMKDLKQNNLSPTLDTRCDCLGVVVPEATKKGYAIAKEGDGIYINRPHQKRDVVQKDKIQTLKTNCDDLGVVVKNNNIYDLFFTIFDLCCIINTKERDKYERSRELLQILWQEIGKKEIWQEIRRFFSFQEKNLLQQGMYEKSILENWKQQPKISTSTPNSCEYNEEFSNREKMFNMWEEWKIRYTPQRWELSKQQFRKFNIFMQELSYETTPKEESMCNMWKTNERFRILRETLSKIQEIWKPIDNKIQNGLRIRKLTPREVFRLMGVKDEDFEKVRKNQSDSSLYHLAGDSIVVNVLMAIFKELI